jgi:hypothetical protein
MGLPKGRTNNPAGRPEGSANKITGEIRERVSNIIDEHFNSETIEHDLKQLDPEKRLHILIKLLEYAIPKLQSVAYEAKLNEKFSVSPKEWV